MQKALKCRKLSLDILMVTPLDGHVKLVLTGRQNEPAARQQACSSLQLASM